LGGGGSCSSIRVREEGKLRLESDLRLKLGDCAWRLSFEIGASTRFRL